MPEKGAPTGELWDADWRGPTGPANVAAERTPRVDKVCKSKEDYKVFDMKCRCRTNQNGLTTTRSTMPINAKVGNSLTPRKNLVECVLWSAAKAIRQRASSPWNNVNPPTRASFAQIHPVRQSTTPGVAASTRPKNQVATIVGFIIALRRRPSITLKVADRSEPTGAIA